MTLDHHRPRDPGEHDEVALGAGGAITNLAPCSSDPTDGHRRVDQSERDRIAEAKEKSGVFTGAHAVHPVTGDELPNPHQLALRTWVNGELRQESNTKELIFDCFKLVEHLSTAFTLEPGDIVATGTPSGIGVVMKPPQLLKAGDSVRIEIEGIGVLRNTVRGPAV